MTRRSNAKRKCLRTKVETHNTSIRNDEGSASLVKSVRRCFNLASDTPWESWGYDSQLQVEPRAVPLQCERHKTLNVTFFCQIKDWKKWFTQVITDLRKWFTQVMQMRSVYNKPRLIRIRFDRQFYSVQAKIRINRRSLFLAWRHLSTVISVKKHWN